jgi:Permeases
LAVVPAVGTAIDLHCRTAPGSERRTVDQAGSLDARNRSYGLAVGFISYAIIQAFSGRAREISWLTYTFAIVLMLYFLFVRSRMG